MSKKTVMVVEDDSMIRETLKYVLEMEGFHTVVAGNGREAMTYLKGAAQAPDLILLDIMMPVMDGHQFRDEQLQDQALARIPTVVISADRSFHQNVPEKGFLKTLKKPIDLEELLGLLHTL